MTFLQHAIGFDAQREQRSMRDFDTIHKVRREYFPEPPPASTMVEVSGFTHPDYLIEMNAIAVLP